jgi:hypothetical protein
LARLIAEIEHAQDALTTSNPLERQHRLGRIKRNEIALTQRRT